jgi:hypothetical protein
MDQQLKETSKEQSLLSYLIENTRSKVSSLHVTFQDDSTSHKIVVVCRSVGAEQGPVGDGGVSLQGSECPCH